MRRASGEISVQDAMIEVDGHAFHGDLTVPAGKFNRAMRINTTLANPLMFLPGFDFGPEANLAFRNLTRAKMLRLATGQQMAAFLRSKGVSVTTLTKPQIRNGSGGIALDGLTQAQRDAFLQKRAPAWRGR